MSTMRERVTHRERERERVGDAKRHRIRPGFNVS